MGTGCSQTAVAQSKDVTHAATAACTIDTQPADPGPSGVTTSSFHTNPSNTSSTTTQLRLRHRRGNSLFRGVRAVEATSAPVRARSFSSVAERGVLHDHERAMMLSRWTHDEPIESNEFDAVPHTTEYDALDSTCRPCEFDAIGPLPLPSRHEIAVTGTATDGSGPSFSMVDTDSLTLSETLNPVSAARRVPPVAGKHAVTMLDGAAAATTGATRRSASHQRATTTLSSGSSDMNQTDDNMGGFLTRLELAPMSSDSNHEKAWNSCSSLGRL